MPTREAVVRGLKEVSEEGRELMRRYMEALAQEKGDTPEGRFEVEFEQVKLYYDAGQFQDALESAEGFLEMAQGEQNPEWEERILTFLGEIDEQIKQGGGSRMSH